jgi:hypothetical protein
MIEPVTSEYEAAVQPHRVESDVLTRVSLPQALGEAARCQPCNYIISRNGVRETV